MTGDRENSSSSEREALPFSNIGYPESEYAESRQRQASSSKVQNLHESEKSQFTMYLKNIDSSRNCICEGMVMAMEFLANSKGVVDLICDTVPKMHDSR